MLALQYHPDRPGTDKVEQTKRFQEINEAYEVIVQHIDAGVCGPTEPVTEPSTSYTKVLGQFVSFIVGKWSSVEDTVDRLFGKMSNGGHGDVFIRTFDAKHIQLLLTVIRDNEEMVARTLGIDVSLVRRLDELIRRRMERMGGGVVDEMGDGADPADPATPATPATPHHIVDVSVDDCMNAHVIEVVYGTTTLYVPSWQYIVSFEVDDEIVTFESKMALAPMMDVDEENNLIVCVSVDVDSVLDTPYIDVPVGSTEFQIPVSELYLRKNQRYVFKGVGIPRISEHDIYRCCDKADVVVVVNIV